MTGTETERAHQWSQWLRRWLKAKGMSVDDLVAALDGKVSRTQAYRWNRGDQPPSRDNAAAVADVFGVDRRQAFLAGGLESDADAPIVAEPAEAFVAEIRARGFPADIEARLIDQIRAEIEQRLVHQREMLDTFATAIASSPEPADEP